MLPRSVRSVGRLSLLQQRCLQISAVNLQAKDPIQNLFLQKVKEYGQKKAKAGGGLVDASPEQEKAMKEELARILKQYGGSSEADMIKLPEMKFDQPQFDPIDMKTEDLKVEVDPATLRKELLDMAKV